MSTISRRDFMKTAGVMTLAVAASAALAGCSTEGSSEETPAPVPTAANEVTYTSLGGEKLTITATAYDYYSQDALKAPDMCVTIAKVVYDDNNKAAVNVTKEPEFAAMTIKPKYAMSYQKITSVDDVPSVVLGAAGIDPTKVNKTYNFAAADASNDFTSWAGGTIYYAWVVRLTEDGYSYGVSSDVETDLEIGVAYTNATAVTASVITPAVKTVV